MSRPAKRPTLARKCPGSRRQASSRGVTRRLALAEWAALSLVLAGAAALRLAHVAAVASDPYYDAAVRSMGLSWHNLLFGALEPRATVSLDKPPLDLWPAVLSTKLFGFGALTIRLPEALAGVAAVALVYLAVRRSFGPRAGLSAGAALAVLPIEVITARSDTTDAIMMALTALALYLVVSAIVTSRTSRLLWAAAALGVAFNVKLAESLLALPPLALIAWLGLRERVSKGRNASGEATPHSQRTGRLRALPLVSGRSSAFSALLAAAAVYVVVALSWLTFTLLVPAVDQPYAVGSTNGSPWDAAFVFNGVDRLRGSQQLEGASASFDASSHYPQATQTERDRIPITPASPTRLLTRVGPLSGERLGLEVLAALLLGVGALVAAWRPYRPRGPGPQGASSAAQAQARIRRAVLSGLALWLLEGIVLFSAMQRLHPRYTEAFTPAVAAMLGIGAAWVCGGSREWLRARMLVAAATVLAVTLYSARLLYGTPAIWWVTLVAGACTLAMLPFARTRVAAQIPLLACMLAIPLWASLNAVGENVSDGNVLGSLPGSELAHLSAYLAAHRGRTRYEVAYDAATKMGALVVHDAQPVLPLTTVEGHLITSTRRLVALARAGRVRYAFLSSPCPAPRDRTNADCSPPAIWVRLHARDVSREAELPVGSLWKLPSGGAHVSLS